MSLDKALGGLQSITTTIGGAANMMARAGADLGAGAGDAGTPWSSQLRPASYRGVPFGVYGGNSKFGRRNAVHEYPFRDTAWVEDLGRSARRINISGFLVGDDVIAQRERMIAACESPGEGELIHPTLGRLSVSNMDFSTEERWDQGRVFEVALSFIEAGQRTFPSVETSTGDVVAGACKAGDEAIKADFLGAAGPLLRQGAAVVAQATSAATAWGRRAQRLANDATNLYNMVGTLKGGFGRYARSNGIGGVAVAAGALSGATNTIPGLIALGSVARTAVASAAGNLASIASGLGS
ncbi:prophage DNA circulation protein [Oxalobacteraceae bacterium GrIS 1.11]